MFYDPEIRRSKLSAILSGLSYIFVTSFYINSILVIRHPDDGHEGNRNMFVKNDM